MFIYNLRENHSEIVDDSLNHISPRERVSLVEFELIKLFVCYIK